MVVIAERTIVFYTLLGVYPLRREILGYIREGIKQTPYECVPDAIDVDAE